jgi:hypothetical protein
LRDGDGAARVLMGGSGLNVPRASRRRALTFVSAAAAGTAVSGTAAAATTAALVKGVLLCVCLGAAGGGLASLAISEAFTRLETPPATVPASAPRPAVTAVSSGAPPALPAAPDPAPKMPSPEHAAPEHAATRDARASTPSPVSNVAAASASANPLPGQSLFEEQRIIESARAAVARRDSAAALATLDGYDRAYAQRQFGPEALALRVEALSAAGQTGRARGLAAEFQRRYPHHPLLSRVQAAVQGGQ